MTTLAARESGLDKEFIFDLNVNSPEHFRELYLGTNVVQQAIAAQDKIIKKIADNGSCVIVGRADDYVLRNYEDAVRIFIYELTNSTALSVEMIGSGTGLHSSAANKSRFIRLFKFGDKVVNKITHYVRFLPVKRGF